MADLFEAVRQIPAYEAAERNGIYLRRNGSKHWACCPLHGEKTPSMCFYDDGGWYCFGCHKGGDTVKLYEELFNLGSYDAAVKVAGDFGIPVPSSREQPVVTKPKASAFHLARALEKRMNRDWCRLCDAKHKADAVLRKYDDKQDTAWDSPEFVRALMAKTYAEQELDWLQQATLVDLAKEYKEVSHAG